MPHRVCERIVVVSDAKSINSRIRKALQIHPLAGKTVGGLCERPFDWAWTVRCLRAEHPDGKFADQTALNGCRIAPPPFLVSLPDVLPKIVHALQEPSADASAWGRTDAGNSR